jgi:hypothetical protein
MFLVGLQAVLLGRDDHPTTPSSALLEYLTMRARHNEATAAWISRGNGGRTDLLVRAYVSSSRALTDDG